MKNKTVCIVGLGYVGLPLAEAFSKHLKTIGFDVDNEKIETLNKNFFASQKPLLKKCLRFFFASQKPLLKMLTLSAAEIVGKNLKKGAIVVLESTVYPGVTEEIIAPILDLRK
ncbi:UDP-N-acetyl-D-mannosamine dehydrogenase [ANME-1 cluster archaeon GoMg1]|nr:UDP-N-acetyl-D-mannosamine dehydrogenase [ANME-1 cluster archaeon GoMg1]